MPTSLPESPSDFSPQPASDALPEATRLRQRVGKRLAALSVVGGLMVALPLMQVLRYQNAEVRALMAERSGLDPVTQAVEAQRSLIAHRDLAALVLRGRSSFEAERKVRQGEVDDHVAALSLTLSRGAWERAVHESDALREDWMLLARQIGEHSIGGGESDQAHRLLVEQTLQVVDLVADAAAPRAEQDGESVQSMLAVSHALPRLAWRLALLSRPMTPNASDVEQAARQRELAAAEAGVARTLGTLNASLVRRPQTRLADAGAAAGAAADRYFHLLRSSAARDAEFQSDIDSSATAAVRAQFVLFEKTHQDAAEALAAQLENAETHRNTLVSVTAALAITALLLLGSLARALRASPELPPPPARAKRSEAEHLLQRLRQRDDGGHVPTPSPTLRGEHEPTMPGRL